MFWCLRLRAIGNTKVIESISSYIIGCSGLKVAQHTGETAYSLPCVDQIYTHIRIGVFTPANPSFNNSTATIRNNETSNSGFNIRNITCLRYFYGWNIFFLHPTTLTTTIVSIIAAKTFINFFIDVVRFRIKMQKHEKTQIETPTKLIQQISLPLHPN